MVIPQNWTAPKPDKKIIKERNQKSNLIVDKEDNAKERKERERETESNQLSLRE
jgi:hypothetical protein